MIRGGTLSRRLAPSEKLSCVVINRWLTWQCTDAFLLFDHDSSPYQETGMVCCHCHINFPVMLRPLLHCVRTTRPLSSEATMNSLGDAGKLKKIGKALETYIKHSNNHATMMAKERAIEYLFPSGLSDLKARPVMQPPDEIFPRFHRFLFDAEGRPQSTRFFTLRPNFYGVLSYAQMLLAFEHLISLPGSSVHANFIMEFRTRCKSTRAEVVVFDAGSGQFNIDGHGLHDFQQLIAREILLSPLLVSGFLGRVDVLATTSGSGGITVIPRAVRHGAALCIAALYPKTVEPLRLDGSSLKRFLRRMIAMEVCIITIMLYLINFGDLSNQGMEPLGYICILLNIINIGAPLFQVGEVIRSKSSESLPLPLCIACFFVSMQWLLYGIIIDDFIIQAPNYVATALSIVQLSLFIIYPRNSNKKYMEVKDSIY
uniref:Sugar transporter SWEET1 n=1 Tax=Heterorhabditis bacteriophora TaxID=37862 RepID=A0A1I7WUU7_HETBA